MRSGLGLAYLLLGSKHDSVIDNYVFQSVQHLRAAVRLTDNAVTAVKGTNTDETAVIHTAAMHNLGLAYVTLDRISSSLDSEARRAHYSEWATSPETFNSLKESLVYLANEGALLLQTGKTKEALSSLESTANKLCTNLLPYGRQLETCLIVKQNMAVAREANWLEQQEPISLTSFQTQSGDKPKVQTEVAENFVVSDPMEGVSKTEDNSKQGNKLVTLNALEKKTEKGAERPHQTRRLLVLARALCSVGDLSGAIDAALKALSAASSAEDSETSTSYLEMLIEEINRKARSVPDKASSERVKETSESVEKREFLQLELELERLKYRVLEQEMMLEHQHRSANYDNDTPRIQTSDVGNDIMLNQARKMTIGQETKAGVSQEEASQIAVVNEIEPVLLANKTNQARNHLENKTDSENQPIHAHTESLPKAVMMDSESASTADELVAEATSTADRAIAEADSTADEFMAAVASTADEVVAEAASTADGVVAEAKDGIKASQTLLEGELLNTEQVEPIVLPSLYEPALRPPTKISYVWIFFRLILPYSRREDL